MPIRTELLSRDKFADSVVAVQVQPHPGVTLLDCGEHRMRRGLAGQVTDVLLSHRHLDHFIGFDRLLRRRLGGGGTLGVWGPAGVAGGVRHKLSAYTWDRIEDEAFRVEVHEVEGEEIRSLRLRATDGFAAPRETTRPLPAEEHLLYRREGYEVRFAILSHGVPTMAFRIQEEDSWSVDVAAMEAAGLAPGHWIEKLKEAARSGGSATIDVEGTARDAGELARAILFLKRGESIAYVTDCSFTDETRERVKVLAGGAGTLFCEGVFAERDRDLAERHRHLTARQAGTLAREAGVEELVLLHMSRRYHPDAGLLLAEAKEVFPNVR